MVMCITEVPKDSTRDNQMPSVVLESREALDSLLMLRINCRSCASSSSALNYWDISPTHTQQIFIHNFV